MFVFVWEEEEDEDEENGRELDLEDRGGRNWDAREKEAVRKAIILMGFLILFQIFFNLQPRLPSTPKSLVIVAFPRINSLRCHRQPNKEPQRSIRVPLIFQSC